ncbi:MAG: hypothetical protein LBT53_00955 [Puniceicoccales bacterium]|jgi:hypothetical protein|nr:hypothetical protein [Puniceicoccales bacterium]
MTLIESLIKERIGQHLRKREKVVFERSFEHGFERAMQCAFEIGLKRGYKIGFKRGVLIGEIRIHYERLATPLADEQTAHLRKMSLPDLQDLFAQVRRGVFPEI